jgi:hypothetical protein
MKKNVIATLLICLCLCLYLFNYKSTFRTELSYYLKHTPMCLAENLRLIKPLRAHFIEDDEITVDILKCTPSAKPKLVGQLMGNDIIVVSDLGGVVQRFNKLGVLLWQTKLKSPRGLFLKNNEIYVGAGKELKKLSIHSGRVLNSYEFNYPINNIFIDNNKYYILFDIDGVGAINEFEFSSGDYILINKSKFISKFPRGLYVDKEYIYVTDTYLHRIIKLEKGTLKIIDETSARFPMGILEFEGVLIVSEDLNVITEFNKAPIIRSGYYVGCRRSTNIAALKHANDMVFCDKESSNQELYSPNDVDINLGYAYVADTHNHRIAIFFNKTFVSQLIGFNNPVNIKIIGN